MWWRHPFSGVPQQIGHSGLLSTHLDHSKDRGLHEFHWLEESNKKQLCRLLNLFSYSIGKPRHWQECLRCCLENSPRAFKVQQFPGTDLCNSSPCIPWHLKPTGWRSVHESRAVWTSITIPSSGPKHQLWCVSRLLNGARRLEFTTLKLRIATHRLCYWRFLPLEEFLQISSLSMLL